MENAERTNLAFDPFLDEGWGDRNEEPAASLRPAPDPYWFLQYVTDQYDWNDLAWLAATKRGKDAWRAIPLWKRRPGSKSSHDVVLSGYFAIVSPCDYQRLTRHPDGTPKRWTLQAKYSDEHPDRIIKAYAVRYGRTGHEPKTVMMHREVVRCLHRNSVADHYNGHGLDNRQKNLAETSQSANMSNSRRARTRNSGLPVGVEMRKFGGEIRYGGIRAMRVPGKKHAKIFRSKRTWKTPGPAAAWYQNQLKKLHGVRPWAHTPTSVSYPLFPPRLESEPCEKSRSLRKKREGQLRKEHELADIPF